jgi:hypothetical protein
MHLAWREADQQFAGRADLCVHPGTRQPIGQDVDIAVDRDQGFLAVEPGQQGGGRILGDDFAVIVMAIWSHIASASSR